AASLEPAVDIRVISPARKPFGTETPVGVLQAERIAVVILNEGLGPSEFAHDRLASLKPLIDRIAQPHQAVRAAASGAADGLLDFLVHQALNRPVLPISALPGFVRIE